MVISPDEAAELTNKEKKEMQKLEELIDDWIETLFDPKRGELTIEIPGAPSARVKYELEEAYKKKWKNVYFSCADGTDYLYLEYDKKAF